MTNEDVLKLLLLAADDTDRIFDHADISEWPDGAIQFYERMGLLRPASGGQTARCPNCADRHIERVEVRAGPDDRTRLFIYCPIDLRIEVTSAMCGGWQIHPDGLARAVARTLQLRGSPESVIAGRLWRLGRIPFGTSSRGVVFATRLTEGDAASVAKHIGVKGRSIVLVPHRLPMEQIWRGCVPATASLTGLLSLDDRELVIDGAALLESVADADQLSLREDRGLDASARKKVRKAVRDELGSMLSDEALRQAFRDYGSYRKAAAALIAQGHFTDRYAVERAVKAKGGPEAVKAAGTDSASVARTVVSQSRDRAKTFLERR